MAVALVAGIFWARAKSHGEICSAVDIVVLNDDSTTFVTPQGVLNDLKGQGVDVVGKRMADINASDIEEALLVSPYLEKADVVKCQNGRLLITVSQLLPVMRVFDGDQSYYVNRAGKRMTATANYHCDAPIVRGHFTRQYPVTRLLPLIDYVEQDSLLRSLVTMYSVQDTNNIILVPDISGHVINIGRADGFENKFAKLKLFYKKVMPARGWNTFDTISVKWNHQIVATRRVKAAKQVVEINEEDDEQAPDIETMTTGTPADVKKHEQEQQARQQQAEKKPEQAEKKPEQAEKKPSQPTTNQNKKKS